MGVEEVRGVALRQGHTAATGVGLGQGRKGTAAVTGVGLRQGRVGGWVVGWVRVRPQGSGWCCQRENIGAAGCLTVLNLTLHAQPNHTH